MILAHQTFKVQTVVNRLRTINSVFVCVFFINDIMTLLPYFGNEYKSIFTNYFTL